MEAPRPLWGTLLALFCVGTVGFLVYRDLTLPDVRDTEVWFGIELTGRAAHVTAPLHWGIFAAGAYGAWRQRPWIWPWASLYALQIAVGHWIWNLTSPRGEGFAAGVAQLLLFSIPAVALWWARPGEQASPPGGES